MILVKMQSRGSIVTICRLQPENAALLQFQTGPALAWTCPRLRLHPETKRSLPVSPFYEAIVSQFLKVCMKSKKL